jgi:hypothetical protein
MTDRPILFSGSMVRALLAGSKTQTRRILKPQPYEYDGRWWIVDRYSGDCRLDDWLNDRCGAGPSVQPGDRLWCRETLKRAPHIWTYAADGAEVGWPARGDLAGKMRDTIVSIHMPRVVSRLTLTVTDVRVERLQDISEEDARAEGVPDALEGNAGDEIYCPKCHGMGVHAALGHNYGVTEVDCRECETARQRYRHLWEHINGAGSWEPSCWVAAYSFTVALGNIDALAKEAA